MTRELATGSDLQLVVDLAELIREGEPLAVDGRLRCLDDNGLEFLDDNGLERKTK